MKSNYTFKEHFGIPETIEVDFFDIPLNKDVEAFICPFLIVNNRDHPVYDVAYKQMETFLGQLNRNFVLTNDRPGGLSFLSNLHEPNEYHLGYSAKNQGKAIGNPRAETIFVALRNNRFARKGITITNEAHNVLLLVKGIGQDIMSDVIANVCRNLFAEYTTTQCLIHSIPVQNVTMNYFDVLTGAWVRKDFMLPFYMGKPVVLIPKKMISGGRAYTSLYNWFVAKYYVSVDLLNGKIEPDSEKGFIINLKDGTKKALIKLIYKFYGKPKEELIDFVLRYNGSLSEFQRYAKDNYPELDLSGLK